MAEARSRSAWQHTSAVLCLLANVHRDHKKQPRPFKPEQFDPHSGPRRVPKGRAVTLDKFVDEIMSLVEKRERHAR